MFSFSMRDGLYETFDTTLEPLIFTSYINNTKLLLSNNSLSILSIIYISGAVFFCLRFLSSLARIHYLYFRFPKYEFVGFKAVVLDSNQSPFTFFNILFISRNDYEKETIDEMIVHEMAHKEAYHSFDILLLELMTIIQWFNPFIWMFRYSLKAEHEFAADNKVLYEGFDRVKYQKLLFEKSLGITAIALTNHFNYSLLKKRLKMMTNKKSLGFARFKYILSIPLLLAVIMLLTINFNSYGQKNKVYTEGVDVMATYRGGDISGVRKFIAENLTYPEVAAKSKVTARIFVQFVVDKKGKVTDVEVKRRDISGYQDKEVVVVGYEPDKNAEINPEALKALEDEAVRVIKLLDGFTPAQKDGKNVATEYTFPIVFTLEKKGK